MGASATRLTSHLRQWSTACACRISWKAFWRRRGSSLTGPLYGGLSLSSHLSDLPGLSGRRMLEALAEGETDPARIAALAAQGVRATQQELCDALSAAATLSEKIGRAH